MDIYFYYTPYLSFFFLLLFFYSLSRTKLTCCMMGSCNNVICSFEYYNDCMGGAAPIWAFYRIFVEVIGGVMFCTLSNLYDSKCSN